MLRRWWTIWSIIHWTLRKWKTHWDHRHCKITSRNIIDTSTLRGKGIGKVMKILLKYGLEYCSRFKARWAKTTIALWLLTLWLEKELVSILRRGFLIWFMLKLLTGKNLKTIKSIFHRPMLKLAVNKAKMIYSMKSTTTRTAIKPISRRSWITRLTSMPRIYISSWNSVLFKKVMSRVWSEKRGVVLVIREKGCFRTSNHWFSK